MNREPLYLLGTGECYPNSWNRDYIAVVPATGSSAASIMFSDRHNYPDPAAGKAGIARPLAVEHHCPGLGRVVGQGN
jgi:hypothetical protein